MAGEWEDVPQNDGWEDVPQPAARTPEQTIDYYSKLGVPVMADQSGNVSPDYNAVFLASDPAALRGPNAAFGQGTSFKWGDEVTGHLLAGIDKLSGSPLPYGALKKMHQSNALANATIYQKENPVSGYGAEIGGGLLQAILGGGLMPGMSSLPAYQQGGLTGLAYGGLTGAGAAGEDERTKGAAAGGITGMLTGAIAAPLFNLAAKGIDKGIVTPLSRAISSLKSSGQPVTAPTTQTAAEKFILKAMEDSGLSVDQAKQKIASLSPQVASQTMIADLTEGTRKAGQYAISNSAGAKTLLRDALEGRARSTMDKVTDPALKRLVGTDANAVTVAKDVMNAARQAAKPLYDKVDETLITLDAETVKEFSRPMLTKAYNKAIQSMKNDPDWPAGIKIPTAKDLVAGKTIPLRVIDYVNRELNDIAGKATREGSNNLARQATANGNRLTDKFDEMYPFYKEARQIWSGGKSFEDAIDLGKKVLSENATGMGDKLSMLSEADKKGAMIGAYQAIREKLLAAKVTGNEANKLSTGLLRERLQNVAKTPDELNQFLNTLDEVSGMYETNAAILGGSPTVERARFAEIVDQFVPKDSSAKTLKSIPANAIDKIVKMYTARDVNKTEAFADDLAKLLVQKGPKQMIPVLDALIKHQSKMTPEQRAQIARIMASGLTQRTGEAGNEMINR